nr:OmpA family protein [Bacillus alkalicola]
MPIRFGDHWELWDNVQEAYGEAGEKLEGDLVQVGDDGEKYIEYLVQLDVPDVTTPEEVDVTAEEEEIKLQVPDDLLFDFDESVLKEEAKETLDEIIGELGTLPEGTAIHINGHTDNVGDPDYNLKLSEDRAAAVFEYLVASGEADHLAIEKFGFGDTSPIGPNDSESERSRNRRVEIVINPQ